MSLIINALMFVRGRLIGDERDFVALFKEAPEVSAGLAASIFHFMEVKIPELKRTLSENGICVRL